MIIEYESFEDLYLLVHLAQAIIIMVTGVAAEEDFAIAAEMAYANPTGIAIEADSATITGFYFATGTATVTVANAAIAMCTAISITLGFKYSFFIHHFDYYTFLITYINQLTITLVIYLLF